MGLKSYCTSSGETYYSSSTYYCPPDNKGYYCARLDTTFTNDMSAICNSLKSSSNDVPVGMIVGVVIGGVVFISIIIFTCVKIIAVRKRMRELAQATTFKIKKDNKDCCECHHHHCDHKKHGNHIGD